jgi:hypothetical protein
MYLAYPNLLHCLEHMALLLLLLTLVYVFLYQPNGVNDNSGPLIGYCLFTSCNLVYCWKTRDLRYANKKIFYIGAAY